MKNILYLAAISSLISLSNLSFALENIPDDLHMDSKGRVWLKCPVGYVYSRTEGKGRCAPPSEDNSNLPERNYSYLEAVDMANKFERAGLRGWRLPSIEEMIESKAFCINEEGKADENDMPTFSFKESKLLCKSGNSPYVITFIDRGIWVRDFSFSYDELLAEKFKKDIVSTDESTAAHHGQRLHYCMTYGGDGGIGIWDCLNIATNTPGGYSGYPVILVNDGDSPRLNKEIEPTVNAMKTFQQNYLKRHQELYRAALAKQTAQEEKHKQINEASIKRLKNFQRNIKVGDRTFNGLILNIKGDLVQVQLTCAKITIIGVCERSSNGEIRWLRRDEIYPR